MITSRQNRLLRFLLPRREYTTIVTIAGYIDWNYKYSYSGCIGVFNVTGYKLIFLSLMCLKN